MARKYSKKAAKSVERQVGEFKRGEGKAKSRKQAIAIGLSEARRAGATVPAANRKKKKAASKGTAAKGKKKKKTTRRKLSSKS